MDKFDQKNQHRATTAATVAVVAAVVVQIVVSCSNTGRARGAAWEPPELRIDPNFSGELPFSVPIFGPPPPPLSVCFSFFAELSFKMTPKWDLFLSCLTLLK